MRHEYENGDAKEVMTFREPEIPTYLEVMAEQKAANVSFYNDTELGRKYLDASKEWDEMSAEDRVERAKRMQSEASHDDMRAFYRKDMAGLEQTLGLLEALEIDGSKLIGDPQTAVLKSPNRRRELQNAHAKMFEDEG